MLLQYFRRVQNFPQVLRALKILHFFQRPNSSEITGIFQKFYKISKIQNPLKIIHKDTPESCFEITEIRFLEFFKKSLHRRYARKFLNTNWTTSRVISSQSKYLQKFTEIEIQKKKSCCEKRQRTYGGYVGIGFKGLRTLSNSDVHARIVWKSATARDTVYSSR